MWPSTFIMKPAAAAAPATYRRFLTTHSADGIMHADKYNVASYAVSADTGTLNANANSAWGVTRLKSDGTRLFVTDNWQANNKIYSYTLSTPWDLSTGAYDSISLTLSPEVGYNANGGGFCLSPDGSKLFMGGGLSSAGTFQPKVYRYDLGTAFNLSTASYVHQVNVGALDDLGTYNVYFKSDGLTMFTWTSYFVIQSWTLSVAWDITTATLTGDSLNLSTYVPGGPSNFEFSSDGMQLFIGTDAAIYVIGLTSAWTLAGGTLTATLVPTHTPMASFAVMNQVTV